MRAGESIQFKNIAATTSPFVLRGGRYGVEVTATFSSGSVTLEKRSCDGSTYTPVFTGFGAAGYDTVDLPVGTYRVAIDTATAVYAEVQRIPVGE